MPRSASIRLWSAWVASWVACCAADGAAAGAGVEAGGGVGGYGATSVNGGRDGERRTGDANRFGCEHWGEDATTTACGRPHLRRSSGRQRTRLDGRRSARPRRRPLLESLPRRVGRRRALLLDVQLRDHRPRVPGRRRRPRRARRRRRARDAHRAAGQRQPVGRARGDAGAGRAPRAERPEGDHRRPRWSRIGRGSSCSPSATPAIRPAGSIAPAATARAAGGSGC